MCVERAAPEPVVIVQVRVALGTGAADTVAGRAIVAEGGLALRHRDLEQRRIGLDLLRRGLGQPLPASGGALGLELVQSAR